MTLGIVLCFIGGSLVGYNIMGIPTSGAKFALVALGMALVVIGFNIP